MSKLGPGEVSSSYDYSTRRKYDRNTGRSSEIESIRSSFGNYAFKDLLNISERFFLWKLVNYGETFWLSLTHYCSRTTQRFNRTMMKNWLIYVFKLRDRSFYIYPPRSVGLSVCLSVCPSVCLLIYWSVSLSVCWSIGLSVCWSVCLSFSTRTMGAGPSKN